MESPNMVFKVQIFNLIWAYMEIKISRKEV